MPQKRQVGTRSEVTSDLVPNFRSAAYFKLPIFRLRTYFVPITFLSSADYVPIAGLRCGNVVEVSTTFPPLSVDISTCKGGNFHTWVWKFPPYLINFPTHRWIFPHPRVETSTPGCGSFHPHTIFPPEMRWTFPLHFHPQMIFLKFIMPYRMACSPTLKNKIHYIYIYIYIYVYRER